MAPLRKRVLKVCAVCGKEYEVQQCREHKTKYCSPECQYAGLKTKKTVLVKSCHWCGKDFSVNPYRKDSANYCSYDCMHSGRRNRTVKQCLVCGKEFSVKASIASRSTNRCCSLECKYILHAREKDARVFKFCLYCGQEFKSRRESVYCSKRCKQESQRPENATVRGFYSSDYWKNVRWQIMERDEFTCVRCGSSHNLHVHHIKRKGNGGGESFDNLITLCRSCHSQEHNLCVTKSH